MFPEYVTEVLQQLSYLALIIIAPCTVYNTIQNITNALLLKNHIALDDERFTRINKDLGKHDSMINDYRMDNIAKVSENSVVLFATTLDKLLRDKLNGNNHA